MSKSKEELDALKEEVETVNGKLQELTPEELDQVTGGAAGPKVEGVIGSAAAAGIILKSF